MSTEHYTMKVGDLQAEVVFKPIRNLHIGVYPPDGRVRVAAPVQMTRDAVHGALALRLVWIKRRIDEFQRQQRESPREYRMGESHWHMGRRYRLRILGHGRSNAVQINGHYLAVTVRGSPTPQKIASAIDRWRRTDLKERVVPVVSDWTQRLGLTAPPSVGVKSMSTRWGTCSVAARRVWFNLALSRLPANCLAYVALHEVAHLVVSDHSADFITLLDTHMPDWRAAKAMLSELPYMHLRTV
jgi:predicted metal-dependent hydrolase